MKIKCLGCKKWLTEEEINEGVCQNCFSFVGLDSYNFKFILCPECGKKLAGVDLKNAYTACCPFCLTVIDEKYFRDL